MATCGLGFDVPSKISVIVTEQPAGNEDVCQHELTLFPSASWLWCTIKRNRERENHAFTGKSGKGGSPRRRNGVQQFGQAAGTGPVRDSRLCWLRFRSLGRRTRGG